MRSCPTSTCISQVGDFSLYLSGKINKGQEITDQEMDSFITLGEYAKELNGSLKDLETTLMEGDIPIGKPSRPIRICQGDPGPGGARHQQRLPGDERGVY